MDNVKKKDNKRIVKNTLFLYFRTFLTLGVSLYTSRVILEVLGIEDYGIYGVVGGVIWLFSFITSSMSGATQRFLTIELGKENKESLNNVFCISVMMYILFSVIILILGETLGLWFVMNKLVIPTNRMNAAFWVYQASIVTAIISFISIPYNAIIIAYERMSAFAYISIYEVIAKLGIVFLISIFDFDKLKLYAFLVMCVQFSIRMIYQFYVAKNFSDIKFKLIWDKVILLKMYSFAGWSLVGNVAYIAYTQGMNIVLNIFFGPVVNAARAISGQVESVVKSFVSNFQTALNPQIVKSYANGDESHLQTLILISCRFSYFLLYILCLPVFIQTPKILDMWLTDVPEYTNSFIHIIIVVMLVETQANALVTAVGATGRIKRYQIVISCILLMILPCTYVGLQYGATPQEAMMIYLLFIIVAQCARLYIAKQIISISIKAYMSEVVLPIFKVTVLSSLLPISYKILMNDNLYLSVVMCVGMTVISIYYIGLKENEKLLVIDKLKNIKNKIYGLCY